jgi:dephospho-CoA kinase
MPTYRRPLRRARRWPPLTVIGVTGGIAAGKSTVTRMLADLGAATLNADDVGREIVRPGEPALAEIISAFGPTYLLPDGGLHRRALGERVFTHPADLAVLNRITHPRIEARLRAELGTLARQARRGGPQLVALEAAVLVEAGWTRQVDVVVVVISQPSTQVARLIASLGMSRPAAEARVRAQLAPRQRERHAHVVLNGETPLPQLREQVRQLWEQLSTRPAPVRER